MNTARTIGLFTLLCFAGTASAATVRDAQRQSFLSARAAYRNTIARSPALQKIQRRELLRRMGTSLGFIDERTATVARGVSAGLIDARTADAWRGAGLIFDGWRDHLAMREASDRIP